MKANIILGVSGGIAAYKSCDVVSGLKATGHCVKVVMTKNAKEFITPLTLSTLSQHPVMDDMWAERKGEVEHIEVAKWADLMIVYPATANIIGKFANGIADDLLSTIFLAFKKPVFIAPAMNTAMMENMIVQKNLGFLAGYGVRVIPPVVGTLVCGDTGSGKAESPRRVVEIVNKFLVERETIL